MNAQGRDDIISLVARFTSVPSEAARRFIGALEMCGGLPQKYDLAIEQIEEMGEHISFSKDKGEWWVHGNKWSVKDKRFPMAIHLAFIKWKEGKE